MTKLLHFQVKISSVKLSQMCVCVCVCMCAAAKFSHQTTGHRSLVKLTHKINHCTQTSWQECKMAQSLCKTIWRFLLELKLNLPRGMAIVLFGTYPREMKTDIHTQPCKWMFTAPFLVICENWKEPKGSVGEWLNKMWYIHPHHGTLLRYIKEHTTDTTN